MDTSVWVSEDFEIQFGKVELLKPQVEDRGFVHRAYGISEAVLAMVKEKDVLDAFLDYIPEAILDGEKVGIDALEFMHQTSTDEDLLSYPVESYYPEVEMVIHMDDLDVGLDVTVVINEQLAGVMQYHRFIAMLLPSQSKPYQVERSR